MMVEAGWTLMLVGFCIGYFAGYLFEAESYVIFAVAMATTIALVQIGLNLVWHL